MTECTQKSFQFAAHFSRRVVAEFSAERLTTDGGVLLLRQVDRRIQLLSRLTSCFVDQRDPLRVEHRVAEMVAQRVYGLALGYEDLNDHEQLRHDPLLGLLAGKRDLDAVLAGKSTLNRMELSGEDPASSRYHKIGYVEEKIDGLLVDLFLEAHAEAPLRIVLDLDSTDVTLHGHQEARFFHGYYDSYCYLPLYIFAGDHLLCARLRPADQDGASGAVDEVRRIVAQIRQRWPQVEIVLRADSGFCREELMGWCEQQHVEYVLGLARNERLLHSIGPEMRQAQQQCKETGKPARVFTAFDYRTHKSWSRSRRVIAKAESIPDKDNPRFVVTSLRAGEPHCTKTSTVLAAKWRTALRNSSACSATGSVPRPCVLTNCDSTSPLWLIRYWKHCGVWHCTEPSGPKPRWTRSACDYSRSPPRYRSAPVASPCATPEPIHGSYFSLMPGRRSVVDPPSDLPILNTLQVPPIGGLESPASLQLNSTF